MNDTLLQDKLNALLEMLKLTKETVITGVGEDESLIEEVEAFAMLYDKRAVLITKIEELDAALPPMSDIKGPLVDKIRETAKVISDLDKSNTDAANRLMSFVKGNLKTIRNGRGINNAYVDSDEGLSGYYFDKSK